MKYPNIKAAHLSHAQIAKAFGYANVKSFRCSSAHQRHMKGLDDCLGQTFNLNDLRVKRIKQAMAMVEAAKVITDSMRGFHQRAGEAMFNQLDKQMISGIDHSTEKDYQTINGIGEFKPDGKPCKVDVIKLQLNQIQ